MPSTRGACSSLGTACIKASAYKPLSMKNIGLIAILTAAYGVDGSVFTVEINAIPQYYRQELNSLIQNKKNKKKKKKPAALCIQNRNSTDPEKMLSSY